MTRVTGSGPYTVVVRTYRGHVCGHPRRNRCRGCRVVDVFRVLYVAPAGSSPHTKIVGPRFPSQAAAQELAATMNEDNHND